MATLGIPEGLAGTFVAVLVVSFALTSVDSATRLLRYNVSEVGETLGISALGNRYVASAIAVATIWFFAFYQVGGEFAGLVLWQLFGTTNQLMAGLALLAITVYLLRRGKPNHLHPRTDAVHAGLDAVGMSAMGTNLLEFWANRQWALFLTGATILALALWLTAEAWLAVRRYRRHPMVERLEVEFVSD